KIPIGSIQEKEIEKLTKLENIIHQRVVNQEKAVKAIARAVRRNRVGISVHGKPIGSFLFLGPTGVGKTETAKALAESYYGSEKMMLRFDMGEYQGQDAVDRVLGSARSKEPGLLTKAIRQNPFSLLLLDEIEKAHRDILNLFLTMLDEGYFTDAFGRKVDCRNLIIIGTSNAGTELIRQRLSGKHPGSGATNQATLPRGETKATQTFDYQSLEKEVIDYIQRERIFSPEFINRFDATIIYQPLTQDHLYLIAELMLKRLNNRLKKKKISVKITPELLRRIVELGYNPALGARPMNRVIQDKVEDQIAQMILKGKTKKGQEVEVKI
ncbi:AAA family ATPase, partial [Patescibacteria group bacterium]